jgi:Flp pilus assembly protein TadG
MDNSRLLTLFAKKTWRREAGSALIEFGLAFPVLMLVLVGTADFGRIFYTYITVANAAHTGAEYGAASAPKTNDTAGINQAALNDATDLTGVTITSTPFCQCSNGSPVNCATSSCSPLRYYVSVTAAKTFHTLIPYPGIPSSSNVTAVAVIRAQ